MFHFKLKKKIPAVYKLMSYREIEGKKTKQ